MLFFFYIHISYDIPPLGEDKKKESKEVSRFLSAANVL